jgi:hypothetical protein
MPEPSDPRQRGFAIATPRPTPATPAEPEPPGPSGLRGIASPPPPKPTRVVRPMPVSEATTSGSPLEAPDPVAADPLPSMPSSRRFEEDPPAADPAPIVSSPRRRVTRGEGTFGTPRYNRRYVQFNCSRVVSDLLDEKAQEEDLVLGEVVLDAIRALEDKPATAVPVRRRRRTTSTSVRRSMLVLPDEADWIKQVADRRKTTPSALARLALEEYLMHNTRPATQPERASAASTG